MVTLPKSTCDVGELLSSAHKKEKEEARAILKIIVSNIRFLARQGLALHGHDETNSNFCAIAEDNPLLDKWLKRTWRKFTSHENQNEFLELMSHSVLRTIIGEIHDSPFLTIMVDETTDIPNREQLTLVIRRVDDNFEIHEEFLGLYNLYYTTGQYCRFH